MTALADPALHAVQVALEDARAVELQKPAPQGVQAGAEELLQEPAGHALQVAEARPLAYPGVQAEQLRLPGSEVNVPAPQEEHAAVEPGLTVSPL